MSNGSSNKKNSTTARQSAAPVATLPLPDGTDEYSQEIRLALAKDLTLNEVRELASKFRGVALVIDREMTERVYDSQGYDGMPWSALVRQGVKWAVDGRKNIDEATAAADWLDTYYQQSKDAVDPTSPVAVRLRGINTTSSSPVRLNERDTMSLIYDGEEWLSDGDTFIVAYRYEGSVTAQDRPERSEELLTQLKSYLRAEKKVIERVVAKGSDSPHHDAVDTEGNYYKANPVSALNNLITTAGEEARVFVLPAFVHSDTSVYGVEDAHGQLVGITLLSDESIWH